MLSSPGVPPGVRNHTWLSHQQPELCVNTESGMGLGVAQPLWSPWPGPLGLYSSQRVSPTSSPRPPGLPSGLCVRGAGSFQDWDPPPTRGYVSYHIAKHLRASDPVD